LVFLQEFAYFWESELKSTQWVATKKAEEQKECGLLAESDQVVMLFVLPVVSFPILIQGADCGDVCLHGNLQVLLFWLFFIFNRFYAFFPRFFAFRRFNIFPTNFRSPYGLLALNLWKYGFRKCVLIHLSFLS